MMLPWMRCTSIFQKRTIVVTWIVWPLHLLRNAVRVTPSGIFQGRDAIRRSFSDALKLGLHDYSAQRTISRPEGTFVFNAGTWQARVGDRSFHGYYTSILTSERGEPKIIEETVAVAAP